MQGREAAVTGKKRRNRGGAAAGWTPAEIARLTELTAGGSSMKEIARALGRSELAVRVKASRLELSVQKRRQGEGVGNAPRRRAADVAAIADRESVAGDGMSASPTRARRVLTADFDLSTLSRDERRILMVRLRVAEAQDTAPPLAMSLPRGSRRLATGRPALAAPKGNTSAVSVLNPLTSPSVEPQVIVRGKVGRADPLPPSGERRGKAWRRQQKEQERERLERHYYERAMTDIRANLFHEVDDILWARRGEFLTDVTEEFALSIAEEVAARDRQYREFWRSHASLWEDVDSPSRPDPDPLDALLMAETDELQEWTLSIHQRAAEALGDALEWYRGMPPFAANREERIARYRRYMEERREVGEREVRREVEGE